MWQLIYENSPWPEKPKLSRNLVSATHSFLSVALLTARRGIKYELVVLNSVSYFIWDLIYMYKNRIEPFYVYHHIIIILGLLSNLERELITDSFYYGELSNFPMYFVYHFIQTKKSCKSLKIFQAIWYPYFRIFKLFPYLVNYFQCNFIFFNLTSIYFIGVYWSFNQVKKLF